MKTSLRKRAGNIELSIVRAFSKVKALSTLFYCLFNRSFDREKQAVLAGRANYHQNLKQDKVSSPLLRRNTHRLEKGLIMRPRRSVFALDYIQETVECYVTSCGLGSVCKEEIKWATDVLNKYFEVCDDPKLEKVRNDFYNCANQSNDQPSYTPYKSIDAAKNSISTPELEKLFLQRRSRRWFMPEPVDSVLVDQAISLASLAPSACNRQPYEFKIYHQKEKVQNIAKLAMGTKGFADNIPCIAVLVGDLSAYPEERDRHVIYIDSSLAAMQFMLALETLNLGSCPINWPDIEKREKKLAREINLPAYKRPIMLIAIGKPDPEGEIPFSQKKGLSILRTQDNTHVC